MPPHLASSAAMPNGRHPAWRVGQSLRLIVGGHGTSNGNGAAARPQSTRRPAVTKEEIVLNGRRIVYRTGGSGPLLVLLHGITSNSATWDRVLPKLARRYT